MLEYTYYGLSVGGMSMSFRMLALPSFGNLNSLCAPRARASLVALGCRDGTVVIILSLDGRQDVAQACAFSPQYTEVPEI